MTATLAEAPTRKPCTRCEVEKDLDAFPRAKKGLHGRRSQCKECHNAHRARLRREQPEIVLAKEKAYRAANVARNRPYQREWKRAEQVADPDKVRRRRNAWRAANAAHSRAWWNAWRAANADRWRAITRLAQQRRRARRRSNLVLPFTQEQLLARMAYWGSRCYMCRGPWNAIEHVKPVSWGGGHLLANLRPSCTSCNTRKGSAWNGPAWAMTLVDLYHSSICTTRSEAPVPEVSMSAVRYSPFARLVT